MLDAQQVRLTEEIRCSTPNMAKAFGGFSLLIASDSWRINIANVETKCSQWLPEAEELLWDTLRNILEHFWELCPTKSILKSLHEFGFFCFGVFAATES